MKPGLAREFAEAQRAAEELGAGKPAQGALKGALRLGVMLGLVVAVLALLHYTPLGELIHNIAALRVFLDSFGVRGEFSFAILTAVLMAIGSPRLVFYGVGGLLFGFWEGLAAALAGSLLGSIVMFRVARWGGRRWVRARYGEHPLFSRIARIRPTVMAVVMVRQLPLSNVLINVGLALSRVRSQAFALGTLIGFLPQGVVACLVGSGLADGLAWEGIAQILIAFGLVAALGVWALRWRSARLRAGNPDSRLDLD
jgi:uncharacterized membrane protein YdjX (TVP38/TMEM64 family)